MLTPYLLPHVSYAALGLAHTLNPLASGGAEHDPTKSVSVVSSAECAHTQLAQAGPSTRAPSTAPIPRGFGKIIRDSDGNVIRVELGADAEDETSHCDTAGEVEMKDLQEPELDKQVITDWVTELGGGRGAGADVVKCESGSSLCLMLLSNFLGFLRPTSNCVFKFDRDVPTPLWSPTCSLSARQ